MSFALRRSPLSLLLVLATLLAWGRPAIVLAQTVPLGAEETRNREEALELFNQGKIAYKAQDYDAALELFRRAQAKFDKEPLIILALAKTLDQAANQEKALLYYQLFLKVAPVTPAFAKDREATVTRVKLVEEILRSRPGVLRFKGLPSGALLEIDHKATDVDAQGDVKLAAGTYALRVTMERRIPFERQALAVAAGEVKVIEVVLLAPVDPSTLPHDHTWAWVAGGATLAGLAVGAVFGAMMLHENDGYGVRFDSVTGVAKPATLADYKGSDGKVCVLGGADCPGAKAEGQRLIAAFESDRTWMYVALGSSAALAVTTGVLFLTAPVKEVPGGLRPTLQVTPTLLPGGGGMALALRY